MYINQENWQSLYLKPKDFIPTYWELVKQYESGKREYESGEWRISANKYQSIYSIIKKKHDNGVGIRNHLSKKMVDILVFDGVNQGLAKMYNKHNPPTRDGTDKETKRL